LQAGVDINTIRAWLGHVSLDTTHIYAEIDLAAKAKALARYEVAPALDITPWRENVGPCRSCVHYGGSVMWR
jgi:hypothetical protein